MSDRCLGLGSRLDAGANDALAPDAGAMGFGPDELPVDEAAVGCDAELEQLTELAARRSPEV